ncbi:YdcF family protein, partial [Rhodococcus sp. NPDC058514]
MSSTAARVRETDRLGFGGTLARWTRRTVAGAVLMGLLLVGGTAARVWQVARIDDQTKADAIVVLGAAQYSGTPSSVFEARRGPAAPRWERGLAPAGGSGGGQQEGAPGPAPAPGRD